MQCYFSGQSRGNAWRIGVSLSWVQRKNYYFACSSMFKL